MRVYFNLSDDDRESIPDTRGVEVADLNHAHLQAERAIAELLEQEPWMVRDIKGWKLIAVDHSGTCLFSIHLDDFVH